MKVTRKTLVSAGVVGVVLAGGISVTAAASDGGVRGTAVERPSVEKPAEPAPASVPAHDPVPSTSTEPDPEPWSPAPEETPPGEDYIVSKEVNPDPEKVAEYWTEHRTEEAEPFPLPVIEGPLEVRE
ncbi:hypothetical protein FHS43_006757 [Streptosporangium becharense]|uniref:Uncharacterized protein n=1 Tax=Streptosporangium becharense TaxID=1816182 RepID=A0A7W9IBF3_9ACTN|nr:hypothetical protein [Streptosporangium becharense]MBB2915437.1 hypothetical protein [Streptosporangium becharense]MBB5817624.1 hypothetical protein [Streptosporangium becharense]